MIEDARGGAAAQESTEIGDGDRLSLGVAARLSALPAGPDPGAQDGQGHDLLAGAVRLHPHQLDPDPPRPVRLRQVRQAGGRLQHRLAGARDPEDPAHRRPAQHRAVRRREPGSGDRQLRHLRRPRLPGRRHVRRRPGRRRPHRRRARGPQLRRPRARGGRRGGRRRGARRPRRERPGGRRPPGRAPGSRSSSTTRSSCSRCRRRSRCTPRAPPWTCSTPSTSI